MMSELKEIAESIQQRLKTPFFGYIFMSFTVINWDPLFFLFSQEAVSIKINYFKSNTSHYSVLFLPFILGMAGALISPWLNFLGALWAELPARKRRILSLESEEKINQLKVRIESKKIERVDNFIKSAKQEIEIKNIEDAEVRAKLEDEIETLRNDDEKKINQNTDT